MGSEHFTITSLQTQRRTGETRQKVHRKQIVLNRPVQSVYQQSYFTLTR